MFKIVTDSNADLPEEYVQQYNIGVMQVSYVVDGITYGEKDQLPVKQFYDMMRHGKMPTTSPLSVDDARKGFEKALEESNEILCLAFSSGLSGIYNNLRVASEELMTERRDCRILVVDTLSASLGQGLLLNKAVRLRDKGKSMDEVAEWVRKNAKNMVQVFTVDDLYHLYRGGRVSRATAFVGTIAGVKPILHVDNEGHLTAVSKIRGRKKSLQYLVEYMGEHLGSFAGENDEIFISHGDDLEAAMFVRDLIKERFGIENYLINHIGPSVGAHSGPGAVALFFMGDNR